MSKTPFDWNGQSYGTMQTEIYTTKRVTIGLAGVRASYVGRLRLKLSLSNFCELSTALSRTPVLSVLFLGRQLAHFLRVSLAQIRTMLEGVSRHLTVMPIELSSFFRNRYFGFLFRVESDHFPRLSLHQVRYFCISSPLVPLALASRLFDSFV